MSVSLSRSPSFCSHSSSPSCSPSPRRIQSPPTTRKANIPRSTAKSPLPFLVTKSDKFAYLGGGAAMETRAPLSQDPIQDMNEKVDASGSSLYTSGLPNATPIRRGQRGAKDATRLSKRKQVATSSSSKSTVVPQLLVMTSTPLAHAMQPMDGGSWTRRRGRTAEFEKHDSSSGSDNGEEIERADGIELSPALDERERQHASITAEARRISMNFASLIAEEEEDELPSPRRPFTGKGLSASLLFSAHGLERNFETKVSMTPPARLSNTYNESPFNTAGLLSYPATEAKKISIPRSNAFGPLAPLLMDGAQSHATRAMRRNVASQGRSALGIDGLPEYEENEGRNSLNHFRGMVESEGAKHSRARTEGAQKRSSKAVSPLKAVQEPRRRAATMIKAHQNSFAMEMDNAEENDDVPPPSPSPAGELLFPKRFNVSEGESSAESDSEGPILRPGARIASTRLGSNRSISTSHCHDYMPSMIGFGGEIPVRSFTTSALKNTHTSQSSISTSHSSSKLSSHGSSSHHNKTSSSSPYKTPKKRRARMPSASSASRSGVLCAASPIATPIQSEEGSLFATPLKEESEMVDTQHKRRSTGSALPITPATSSSRLFPEASPVSLSPLSRSKRSSLPPLAPDTINQRKMALNKSEGTPSNALGFDDSGVAFVSPAGTSDKFSERALGKHLGLGLVRAPEAPGLGSPSTAALGRRAALDHTSVHPFGVRERSALANETRLSDGSSSTSSSPEIVFRNTRVGSASSVPEGLASPARYMTGRRTSASAIANEESMTTRAPYLTPQNYKNVLPLQTAFMSTGLASKRNRPTMGTVDLVTGETLPPLPPKPNFALASGSATSAQVGLREVVAAANAHSAANNKPATMPDTPMKKSVFPPFAGHAGKALPMEVSKFKTTNVSPTLPSMLSPPPKSHGDGNESSSSGGSVYDGDSPLLNQDCESPTLGLTSISGKTAWTTCPQRVQTPFRMENNLSVSPTHSIPCRKGPAPPQTSPEIQVCEDGKDTRLASSEVIQSNNNSLSAFGSARLITFRGRSVLMQHRPSLGLQRKSSFGPASEQGLSLSGSIVNSPVLGDFVPTTPTRNSASIKWFEAAQLMTTPSPSSRRRGAKGRSDSYHIATNNRSSRLRMSVGASEGDICKPLQIEKVFHFKTRFNVQSTIGKGEFSQVDKVEDMIDGCLYAVKRMKKPYLGPRDRLRRLEEVDILRHLSQQGGHLNIISMVDAWEESGSLFIQTELCPCVDFSSFLQHNANMGGSLEEARLWKVFKELNDGLRYIHDKGVLHLDLKPANIFITEIATLKIGDFGMATRWPTVDANTILQGAGMGDECNADTNALSSKKGTNLEREGDREYIAPEIIFEGRYSKAADVFSLGLILLEAAGNVILPDNGEPWQKLRNDDLSDVDLSLFSTSLIRLIEACLQSNPDKRPTTEDIQQHPVLQAVSKRVALGVQVSELDQLPIFDLPSGDSTRSLASKLRMNSEKRRESTDDTEMEDVTSARTAAAAASSSSSMNAQGSEDELDKVLDIRGALIHESIHFLMDVLEADPDPSARLFRDDYSPVAPLASLPTINVEEDEKFLAPVPPNVTLQHIPFRASPLRQQDEDENEMEVDQT